MATRQIYYHRPGTSFLGALFSPVLLGPPVKADSGPDPQWVADPIIKPRDLIGPRLSPPPPAFGSDMGTPGITGAPVPTPATGPATAGGFFGSIPPLYLIGGAAVAYFLFFRKKR